MKQFWTYLGVLALIGMSFTGAIITSSPAHAAPLVCSFTNKTTADGLGSNGVFGVYVDGDNVYAATQGGLSISADGGATFTNSNFSPLLPPLYGVYADGDDVYVATDDNGVAISADGGATFTQKDTRHGLGDYQVWGVYVVGSNVYAATNNGLSISTDGGATFTTKTTADGLGDNVVFSVYVVGSTVYAGTDGGLSISTDGGATFTNRTTANGLGNNDVSGVFAVGSTVYAATAAGLSISTNGGTSFTNRDTLDGLRSNAVLGVFVDGGSVYAATASGLSISTDGGATFTTKTTADGLGDNVVRGVFVDGTYVYAATDGGLGISSDCVSSSSDSSSSDSSTDDEFPGPAGIFLTVFGSVGDRLYGTDVLFGSYAIAPNSPYLLSWQGPSTASAPRVLRQGRVNSGGHLEEQVSLPSVVSGTYKLVLTGTSAAGAPLRLTNIVTVDSSGVLSYSTPESLQPYAG